MYHPWRPCVDRMKALGISDDEISEGIALYEQRESEHRAWVARYGSPEYGGWQTDPRDGRRKPHQVIEAIHA